MCIVCLFPCDLSVCLCVCLVPCNLRGYFISLLVELMAGKNVSPSDRRLWRILKSIIVAEKWSCEDSSIGCHLETSSLLLMYIKIWKH